MNFGYVSLWPSQMPALGFVFGCTGLGAGHDIPFPASDCGPNLTAWLNSHQVNTHNESCNPNVPPISTVRVSYFLINGVAHHVEMLP